jgi:hypothetical protein
VVSHPLRKERAKDGARKVLFSFESKRLCAPWGLCSPRFQKRDLGHPPSLQRENRSRVRPTRRS